MSTIVAAGQQPSWLDSLRSTLGSDLLHVHEREGYVPRLADTLTALIFVDGHDPDWSFWTATPKASPATRRIPIILVSDQPEIRRAALASGADVTVTSTELASQVGQLIRDYARVSNPDVIAELDCRCKEELPLLAQQGVEKFNAGEYYAQHDLFEALWMQTEAPIRDLYRAILQVGVAYYQITRGNHRGALKMLLRSVQWLAPLPDVCQGVDVKQLREDSYRVRALLESMNPEEIGQFDLTALRPIQIIK